MTVAEFTSIVFVASLLAGFLGSLTGLGGGVIVTPVLALFLGVDLRYAIGATLVSVIATSSGAAAAYVRDGYSNIRVGMFLEIATTLGALLGAFLAAILPTNVIAVVFGMVLLLSAYLSSRPRLEGSRNEGSDPLAAWLRLDAAYPTPEGSQG